VIGVEAVDDATVAVAVEAVEVASIKVQDDGQVLMEADHDVQEVDVREMRSYNGFKIDNMDKMD
jgi:hypothetical protein